MSEHDWLAEQFEAHRPHLRAVAYRMLGSKGEADDVVQESWIRVSRSDTSGVENLGGWLTTVVARVCLNVLHARRARREEPIGVHMPYPVILRTDRGAASVGAPTMVRGARAVAEGAVTAALYVGSARLALVNGAAGVVSWDPDGRPFSVMGFIVERGKIVAIDVLADPARLSQLDLAVLDD
jgi:hypothetical protein